MTRFYMQDGGDLESRIIAARLREANMGLLKSAKTIRREKTRRLIFRTIASVLGWCAIAFIFGIIWIATGR